jgi:hypothetical protein
MDPQKEPDVTKHLDEDRLHPGEPEELIPVQVLRDVGLYYKGYHDAIKTTLNVVVGILVLAILFSIDRAIRS